ncbi:MAG: methyltransferase domain-containing protein [Anaerolineae bacterium]|nr:methyltransferase domain-containing protein [Anaerolineae bacterium]
MSDTKQSVQQQFGQVAANYRTSAVHAAGSDLAMMVKATELRGNERVLDAGCGAGHTAVTFAPHVGQVTALDLTETMLEQVNLLAQEKGLSNITTQRGDVEQLPFDDASFDIVTSRYSAHHYPNPRQAVNEFFRVLKPGGRFILSDIVASEVPVMDTFLQTIELLRDISHVRDHSITQWQAMLGEAGFETTLLGTAPVPLNFDAWVKRIATPDQQVAMLKTLWDSAPTSIREAFQVEADYSFTLTVAVLAAVKA